MQVQIYKDKQDGEVNFIQEIKFIRTLCHERYGFLSGLKESKELIDSVYSGQQQARSEAKKVAEVKTLLGGLSYAGIEEVRKYFGWEGYYKYAS